MGRVFDPSNAAGATVADIDTKAVLERVASVDIDAGEVRCFHHPYRIVGDEVDSFVLKYQAIYPIYGGSFKPVLFHCYGRKA